MKFNTRVLAAVVGVSSVQHASAIVNACDSAIVQQAADEGFLEFVVTNCMNSLTSTTNFLGDTTVGASACLADWVIDHSDGDAIPDTGNCRRAFQNLVTDLHAITNTDIYDTTDLCTYDSVRDKLTINTACMLAMKSELTTFVTESGSYLGGANQCLATTVRKLAEADALSEIIAAAVANPTDADHIFDPTLTLVDSTIDLGSVFCYACYTDMYETIRAATNADASLATACLHPLRTSCLRTTAVAAALEEFTICSGGMDIQFDGPVCTLTDVLEIQQLIPAPYFTFTHCAFYPEDVFCSTLNSYLAKIKEESDSSCVLCYKDFQAMTIDDATISRNEPLCTGASDVWAPNCVAAVGTSLTYFEACSGFPLNTTKPDVVVPVITTTAAPTTATTTEATTTTAEPETTTVAPETTKSAAMITTGLMIAVSLALAF